MKIPWYKRLFGTTSEASHSQTSETINRENHGSYVSSSSSLSPTHKLASSPQYFSVNSLNLAAAHRQATLGTHYIPDNNIKKKLQELKAGTVKLPPHAAWTGDYTDWVADPFKDLNWRFQFQTLRWINPYLWDALDGNQDSKNEWKRIVQSWSEANTPPNDAPDKYAWMDMTDGNRAIQISIGAPLIETGEDWYVDLLVEHRNWLMNDDNIVKGNHGLHQNLGLFVVASVLNDREGSKQAIARLGSQIMQVFDKDGLNLEGSVAYHEMNLNWWLEAKKRLELEGHSFPEEAEKRLIQAGRVLATLVLPDGTKPQIGDGGRAKARTGLHPLLDKVLEQNVGIQNLSNFHHYETGFTIFRSGWGQEKTMKNESHTVIRHGKELARHSHYDRGSIHLYCAGQRWITDGGFHSYQAKSPDRRYTISRQAHSLVDIPNQTHKRGKEVPATLVEEKLHLYAVELLDDNFDAATWRRRVVYIPEINVWVIWDRVTSEMPDEIRQQWLIDVGIDAHFAGKNLLELTAAGQTLQMQWLGSQPGFDIVVGDPSSEAKRGLVGVGWKKMKPGTSVHATFYEQNVDSIVVISDSNNGPLKFEITDRIPMTSFDLQIHNSSPRNTRSLTVKPSYTDLL